MVAGLRKANEYRIACGPRIFAFRLKAGAVCQEIERAGATWAGRAHIQRILAAAQGAMVGHCPIQSDLRQKVLRKKQSFAQAAFRTTLSASGRLDRRIAKTLLATALAVRLGCPDHRRAKPDRKRSAALQRELTNSLSCTSSASNWSRDPAIILDSRYESFTELVQQSPEKTGTVWRSGAPGILKRVAV